jgi:hypothetical protein
VAPIISRLPDLAPALAPGPFSDHRPSWISPTPHAKRLFSRTRDKEHLNDLVPLWTNWDYRNWRLIWRAIRHAMIGEVEIKRHGTEYLPKPEGMDSGPVFGLPRSRRLLQHGLPDRHRLGWRHLPPPSAHPQDWSEALKLTKRVSKDGFSLLIFSKVVAQEMLSVGRYGVLADKPVSSDIDSQPYLAGYTCENILDWTQVEIDGRFEFDYILLREFHTDRRQFVVEGAARTPRPSRTSATATSSSRIAPCASATTRGRQRWEYFQALYIRDDADADLTESRRNSTSRWSTACR